MEWQRRFGESADRADQSGARESRHGCAHPTIATHCGGAGAQPGYGLQQHLLAHRLERLKSVRPDGGAGLCFFGGGGEHCGGLWHSAGCVQRLDGQSGTPGQYAQFRVYTGWHRLRLHFNQRLWDVLDGEFWNAVMESEVLSLDFCTLKTESRTVK